MANYDEDDLFKHTSMTFGEHLEELRSALFKAVIALGLGFAVSLFFGTTIVGWIQKPLHDALSKFYQDDAMKYVNAHVPRNARILYASNFSTYYVERECLADFFFGTSQLTKLLKMQVVINRPSRLKELTGRLKKPIKRVTTRRRMSWLSMWRSKPKSKNI